MCKLLVHAADLSNPVRPFALTQAWARRISDEFNQQVAKEQAQGMPVLNFMMTPDDKSLCKNEIGNVPEPYFSPAYLLYWLLVLTCSPSSVLPVQRRVRDVCGGSHVAFFTGLVPRAETVGRAARQVRAFAALIRCAFQTLPFLTSSRPDTCVCLHEQNSNLKSWKEMLDKIVKEERH